MKAVCNGVTIADSGATVVVEGNHYFPPDAHDQAASWVFFYLNGTLLDSNTIAEALQGSATRGRS